MNREAKFTRVAFGVYFLISILFVLLRTLSAYGVMNFLGEFNGYIFTIIVQIVLLFCGSVFLFSFLTKNKVSKVFEFYKFKKISKKSVLIAFGLGFVVFFLNLFVSNFFNSIISLFGYQHSSIVSSNGSYPFWLLILNLIFTAVLPSICEETAHRGMLLNSGLVYGKSKAIILSAVMFGLLHLNIEQFFYATLIGLYLGFLTVYVKSIVPAIIIHFMNNALSVILNFSQANDLFFGRIFVNLNNLLSSNLVAAIFLLCLIFIVFCYLLIKLTSKLFLDSTRNRIIEGKKEFDKIMKKELYFMELESVKNGGEARKNYRKIDLDNSFFENLFLTRVVGSKKDRLAKAFIFLCLILTCSVTIFTFVWGVL